MIRDRAWAERITADIRTHLAGQRAAELELGKIAEDVIQQYGADRLSAFAAEIGESAERLREFHTAYLASLSKEDSQPT